jgi:four helix bundle protein
LRDPRKLRAFELADELVLAVYKATSSFPKGEQFGLTSQMRRAAVSVASNIVEGCARHSELDYVRFLDMAFGSAKEVAYQVWLSHRLGFIDESAYAPLQKLCDETSKVLNGLLRSLRKPHS